MNLGAAQATKQPEEKAGAPHRTRPPRRKLAISRPLMTLKRLQSRRANLAAPGSRKVSKASKWLLRGTINVILSAASKQDVNPEVQQRPRSHRSPPTHGEGMLRLKTVIERSRTCP